MHTLIIPSPGLHIRILIRYAIEILHAFKTIP
jgi:hypothetical protein